MAAVTRTGAARMMPRTVLTSSLLRTHPPTRMPRSWYVNDAFPTRLDALAFLIVATERGTGYKRGRPKNGRPRLAGDLVESPLMLPATNCSVALERRQVEFELLAVHGKRGKLSSIERDHDRAFAGRVTIGAVRDDHCD